MSALLSKRTRWFVVGLCGCLLTSLALAQPQINQLKQGENQSARPDNLSRSNAQSQNPDVDRYLASCLLAKNQAEIEISQIAQQKSQDAEVKKFAEQIVNDHQKMAQQLQPIASMQSNASDFGGAARQTNERRQQGLQQQANDPTRRARSSESAADDRSPVDQLIAIDRQIADQATQAVRQSLQEKSPSEVGECYLASQVACHMQMKAALTVIQNQASGKDLQKFAQDQLRTVDQHLQRAEQLLAAQSDTDRRAARPVLDREGASRIPR